MISESAFNKMNSQNLAIVIGPNLTWSRNSVTTLAEINNINTATQYIIDSPHLFDKPPIHEVTTWIFVSWWPCVVMVTVCCHDHMWSSWRPRVDMVALFCYVNLCRYDYLVSSWWPCVVIVTLCCLGELLSSWLHNVYHKCFQAFESEDLLWEISCV